MRGRKLHKYALSALGNTWFLMYKTILIRLFRITEPTKLEGIHQDHWVQKGTIPSITQWQCWAWCSPGYSWPFCLPGHTDGSCSTWLCQSPCNPSLGVNLQSLISEMFTDSFKCILKYSVTTHLWIDIYFSCIFSYFMLAECEQWYPYPFRIQKILSCTTTTQAEVWNTSSSDCFFTSGFLLCPIKRLKLKPNIRSVLAQNLANM